MDKRLVDKFRNDFLLDRHIVFLNHGSFGATPKPVFAAYQAWQAELERQPVEFLGRRAPALMRAAREALGAYLHTAADNLVFVTNATTGINIAARSLNLSLGDEVLASDHEYGALDRTWRFLSGKNEFKYINPPLPLSDALRNPDDFVGCFWKNVTGRTKVIFLSHITSPTAVTFPVAEICRRARAAGIMTIVDGAHTPGQIPLDLDALGADVYSGNLHKWLCAPKGSGFLYVHPEIQPLIEPLVVSWGWQSDSPGPSRFVDEQEWTGTRDLAAFLTVPTAIDYQSQHDWDAVRAHAHALAAKTQERITALTGLSPLHGPAPEWFAQMAASQLPDWVDLDRLKAQLYDAFRIEVPVIAWNGRKLIRYSYQAYNSSQDADALLDALGRILRQ